MPVGKKRRALSSTEQASESQSSGEHRPNESESYISETDPAFEDELRGNPLSLRAWSAYTASKRSSPEGFQRWLYERSVCALPRCFKLWSGYLRVSVDSLSFKPETDRAKLVPLVIDLFERATGHLYKFPRIWLMYLDFLTNEGFMTRTRLVLNRALVALPVSQHSRIWEAGLVFIKKLSPPLATVHCLFDRYLQLEPEAIDNYIAYLTAREDWEEVAHQLVKIASSEEESSKPLKEVWLQLSRLVTRHVIKSISAAKVIRAGISRFPDIGAQLWGLLAEKYLRTGNFLKTRDIYEEALGSVSTLEDFAVIFEGYQTFLDSLVGVYMKRGESSKAERSLKLLERLQERREELLNDVRLRMNPHSVFEWMSRVELFQEESEKTVKTYTDAIKSIDPLQAIGPLGKLWGSFAKFYWDAGEIDSAREIFERAIKVKFRHQDDLATVWLCWIGLESDLEISSPSLVDDSVVQPLKIARRSLSGKNSLRSVKLWEAVGQAEERWGSRDSARAVYDSMIDTKLATIRSVLHYSSWEWNANYFEKSFQVMERSLGIFPWPHCKSLWFTYSKNLTDRYRNLKGSVDRGHMEDFFPFDRVRDVFERCLSSSPAEFVQEISRSYATIEAELGQKGNAIKILSKACEKVHQIERLEAVRFLIEKVKEWEGPAACRKYFDETVNLLRNDVSQFVEIARDFANYEATMGEVDRARGIFSQTARSVKDQNSSFWEDFKTFELKHGNEETYKDFKRIKRATEAIFSGKIMESAKLIVEDSFVASAAPAVSSEDIKVAAEEQLERSTAFYPSDMWKGSKIGFIFKMGVQGLGYYRDLNGSYTGKLEMD